MLSKVLIPLGAKRSQKRPWNIFGIFLLKSKHFAFAHLKKLETLGFIQPLCPLPDLCGLYPSPISCPAIKDVTIKQLSRCLLCKMYGLLQLGILLLRLALVISVTFALEGHQAWVTRILTQENAVAMPL